MKAVVLEEFGGPEKLLFKTDVADPEVGEDEVLIATAAASVNPVDWKIRTGEAAGRMGVALPWTPGVDVSGIVRATGAKVSGVAVGDRVMAFASRTYAELVKVTANTITHIPDGMETVDAAALPLVVATGDQLVRDACGLQPGQTVLVSGATGSVGRCAVHSAKMLGAKVFAAVRGKHVDEAKALGLDGVVALDGEDAAASVGKFDAVADTVGGDAGTALMAHVRDGGVFGTAVAQPASAEMFPNVRFARVYAHPDANRLKDFAKDLLEKKFALPIATRYALQDAGQAQEFARKGAGGKVLLMLL